MTPTDRTRLTLLADTLRKRQKTLLIGAAAQGGMPSASTLRQVAELELNISAIENTLADET